MVLNQLIEAPTMEIRFWSKPTICRSLCNTKSSYAAISHMSGRGKFTENKE